MFRVIHKDSGIAYNVYHTSVEFGQLMFFIYNRDGKWVKMYASEFKPYEPECGINTTKKILNENVTEVKKCLL